MSHTVCQPEIAAANNKKKVRKAWTQKEWKVARAAFIKAHGCFCDWCGADKYLTVHHPFRNVLGMSAYLDFDLSGCVLLCRSCHSATHAGMVLCDYKEGSYHEDGNKHYRYHDAEKCSFCFKKEHPEVEIAQKAAKKAREKRARDARKRQAEKAKQWKKDHPLDVKVPK